MRPRVSPLALAAPLAMALALAGVGPVSSALADDDGYRDNGHRDNGYRDRDDRHDDDDDDHDDHDRARRALESGKVLPLVEILTRLAAVVPGRVIKTELDRDDGRYIYEFKLVSPDDHLYGDDDAREANALEAVIARLRRKLGAGIIETRRGFGYTLAGEPG